jgi:hypothetical protein
LRQARTCTQKRSQGSGNNSVTNFHEDTRFPARAASEGAA